MRRWVVSFFLLLLLNQTQATDFFVPSEEVQNRWGKGMPGNGNGTLYGGILGTVAERLVRHPCEVIATDAQNRGGTLKAAATGIYQARGVVKGLYPEFARGLFYSGVARALSPLILSAAYVIMGEQNNQRKSVGVHFLGGVMCGAVDAPFLYYFEKARTLKILPVTLEDFKRGRFLLVTRTGAGSGVLFGLMNMLQDRFNPDKKFSISIVNAIGSAYATQLYAAPMESMRIAVILDPCLSYWGALKKTVQSGAALTTIKARGFGQAVGWVTFCLLSDTVLKVYGRVVGQEGQGEFSDTP